MTTSWLRDAENKLERMPEKARELREAAKKDLYTFACLVNKGYMYGDIHRKVYKWLEEYTLFGTQQDLTSNKLIMLPRAHLKSHMVATWCAWMVVRHPEITILYLSATSELAQVQLIAIQNIFESQTFQRYFPEYIHPQDGKREKWTAFKIIIDHVKRKQEGIRDATIATAGLTTNTTGWHADVIIADDLVVPENAYTEDGRESVVKKASQFTSIRNPGGFTLACGTRYHPRDVYGIWKEQVYDVYDDEGNLIDKKPVWEVSEYAVEDEGEFIWPRQIRDDGKAFGFDLRVLSRIKAEYEDRTQFFAQYYNNPNDPESDRISRTKFQYANPRHLIKKGGRWYYSDNKLNVYAAIDFAFSHTKAADWTAIVVIGIDHEKNIFVLDIDRFKTDKTLIYFRHIADLHSKWGFNKLRAETTVAQKVIVNTIKDFLKSEGLTLPIDEFRPSRADGSKEERIAAVLEPKYDNLQVWHFEGGWTPALEEELIQARPQHDDIKDAMAAAVSIAIAPKRSVANALADFMPVINTNRFGGVPYR